DGLCGIFCRLPVGVVGATFDVVDHLAVEVEGDAEFDQRFHHALPGDDVVPRRRDVLQMPGTDGGQRDTARAVQVDHAATGKVALEGAGDLLLNLCPRPIGNWRKLAVQVIHDWGLPLSEPMPREPSDTAGMGWGGAGGGATALGSAAGAACVTSSRKVAVGTKNRLPVTARLKSRMRS